MLSKIAVRAAKTAKPAARIPVRTQGRARANAQDRTYLQPSLKVGAANDPLEHEAEAMAERVATMSAPAPDSADAPPVSSDPGPGGAPPAAGRRMISRADQPSTEEFERPPAVPADHQDPEIADKENVDTAALQEDEFAEIESGEPKNPEGAQRENASGDAACVGAEGGEAPADVGRAVAQPGAGRALPASVRAFMEPRFGVDFSDVRIHDAPGDRRAASRIGARAFTHRRDIWLGPGETAEDRRLMAHELTHVVQQTQRRPLAPSRQNPVSRAVAEPVVRRGALADKAESIARNVPGYRLICVILGRSPITDQRVERNAENLIGGFLGLIPGGGAIFDKLKETRVLERAFSWVSGRLSELNITWSRIKRLISKFTDEMPAWSPVETAKRVFGPLVDDLKTFITEIKDKILEFVVKGALTLAGPYGERVWGVISKARDTISLIVSDPLGFAKNLLGAVAKGFRQFYGRVFEHLKQGLMGWLLGTLQGVGIELPQKLDFKGILSVVLQIIGLTYANFRRILVKRLGRNGEKKVSFLEKSVDAVKTLLAEGFVGLWQRVVEMIEGFKQTVIDGIRNFVIETIVKGALSWLAGLSNPIGGIIKVALAIYNIIKAFLERLEQILEVANAIFSSIGSIARGMLKQAADFIENTISKTIPVFLAFVAALVPISGITKTIKSIIKKLQAPVTKAMDKLVGFVVKKAKKLFSKVLGKINKKRKQPEHGLKIGGAKHELRPKKKGKKFELMMATKEAPVDKTKKDANKAVDQSQKDGNDAPCVEEFAKVFNKEIDEAEKSNAKLDTEQSKSSTKKQSAEADKETKEAAEKLTALAECLEASPFLDDKPEDGSVLRAIEPRIPKVEGEVGSHYARGQQTRQTIKAVAGKAALGSRGQEALSNYYENDHIPEKAMGKAVHGYISKIEKMPRRSGTPLPNPIFGKIDEKKPGEKAGSLPAMTIYRPIHIAKGKFGTHKSVLSKADEEKTPLERIAVVREGIQAQMSDEMNTLAKAYKKDKAATAKIRGKIEAGLKTIAEENEKWYGIGATGTPKVPGGGEGGEGSELPLGGDGDLPDFWTIEGEKYTHSKGTKLGIGKYIEFDHVIEATLAEGARDLRLSADEFRNGTEALIDTKAKETAQSAASGEKKSEQPPDPAALAAAAKKRLKSLSSKVFLGDVKTYNRGKAPTIALYRPVHRKATVTPAPLTEGLDFTEARTALAEWALTPPGDKSAKNARLEAARAPIRSQVEQRFDRETSEHSSRITNAYTLEFAEFKRINPDKAAHAKMRAIMGRAATTLKALRQYSLDLVS